VRDCADTNSEARDVALTLRPTGLSSPTYRDWLDYVIVEDGRDVGRLYEDRNSRPELRWFWSITVYVNPKLGITTSGRAPSLEAAKPRSWAITLIKNRGVLLGYVEAPDEKTAELAAAKTLTLSEWQRKRLLIRERA
jgi:hypothetical protein